MAAPLEGFGVLVIIACLIAIPIAYYFMSGWLQHYTYRTELSWRIFVVAIAGAFAKARFVSLDRSSFQDVH